MNKIVLKVKSLEQSAYDSRGGISMAMAYATSDIGTHHTRAWTIAKEIELAKDWSDEEKVDLIIYHQTFRPLFDMLGICRIPWIELGLNERHSETLYNSVTGNSDSLPELLDKSNQVDSITRLINSRRGLSRKDDTLPYKVYSCLVRAGATAGMVIDKKYFQLLLDLYYKKPGWDKNGMPSPEIEKLFTIRPIPQK